MNFQITGWLTNNGKFIECEIYEHFKVQDPIIESIWNEYKEDLETAYEGCSSLIDQGEHPEWHTYEMFLIDCQFEAYRQLYKKGYLRIFNYGTDIGIEGFASSIESQKSVLKKMSDDEGRKIKTFLIDRK